MKVRMEGIHIVIDFGQGEVYLLHSMPFVIVHIIGILGPLFIWLYYGLHWHYFLCATIMYFIIMSGVTIANHRYFSHRAFTIKYRWFQFFLAFWAMINTQKGVLWWAAKHRIHHRYSDKAGDPHSPYIQGFWFSHFIWILTRTSDEIDLEKKIPDFYKFKELRWLNDNHLVPSIITGALIFFSTLYFSQSFIVATGMLVCGFFFPVVVCYHVTFSINSLSHIWGSRRFNTKDQSRNNFILALFTLGEGWHNNHHHRQVRARQGIYWWEIDISYYLIYLMYKIRLIYSIRE